MFIRKPKYVTYIDDLSAENRKALIRAVCHISAFGGRQEVQGILRLLAHSVATLRP